MGYRMKYDGDNKKGTGGRTFRRFFMTTAFFACFLWLVESFWPEGRNLLKQLMIPGDADAALEAAEVFAQEIGSGFSLMDAARNFCDTVMNRGYSA